MEKRMGKRKTRALGLWLALAGCVLASGSREAWESHAAREEMDWEEPSVQEEVLSLGDVWNDAGYCARDGEGIYYFQNDLQVTFHIAGVLVEAEETEKEEPEEGEKGQEKEPGEEKEEPGEEKEESKEGEKEEPEEGEKGQEKEPGEEKEEPEEGEKEEPGEEKEELEEGEKEKELEKGEKEEPGEGKEKEQEKEPGAEGEEKEKSEKRGEEAEEGIGDETEEKEQETEEKEQETEEKEAEEKEEEEKEKEEPEKEEREEPGEVEKEEPEEGEKKQEKEPGEETEEKEPEEGEKEEETEEKEEEEKEKEMILLQVFLKRNGETVAEALGDCVFTDSLTEEGNYCYTLEDQEGNVYGDSIFLGTRRSLARPQAILSGSGKELWVEQKLCFQTEPDIVGEIRDSVGLAKIEYKRGGEEASGEYSLLKSYDLGEGRFSAGENRAFDGSLKLGELKDQLDQAKDGSHTYTFRITNVVGGVTEISFSFLLDRRPPLLEVWYPEGVAEEREQRIFYQRASEIQLCLWEEGFEEHRNREGDRIEPVIFLETLGKGTEEAFLEETKRAFQGKTGEDPANRVEWIFSREEKGGVARGSFSLPEIGQQEVSYRFWVQYQDRAGNVLEKCADTRGDMENGLFTSYELIMDCAAPKLIDYTVSGNARYRDGGIPVYQRNEAGGDLEISFTIEDNARYWQPEAVGFRIWREGSQSPVVDIQEGRAVGKNRGELEWEHRGDLHKATYCFYGEENQEGEYYMEITYQDRAGNPLEEGREPGGVGLQWEEWGLCRGERFILDHVAPVITVVYDQNEPLYERFYPQARTAVVTIQEPNFDKEDVVFTITNTLENQPEIGGFTSGEQGEDKLHSCKVNFQEDGDYTFSVAVVDLAGNRAEYEQTDMFTIDVTPPLLTVSYNNDSARNEWYYPEGRTATLAVEERNFDPALVKVQVTAEDAEEPTLSGWRQEGDVYKAQVSFSEDGVYSIAVEGEDLAGHSLPVYEREHFVIDQTEPKLQLLGVFNQSANNGEVILKVRCEDKNFDFGETRISLQGSRRGVQEIEKAWEKRTPEGLEISFPDFPYEPEADDLYILEAEAMDLAGNHSKSQVEFSINRFGSVYTLGEATAALAGAKGSFYTAQAPDIIVTETNVDMLEFQEITCRQDGQLRTLKEGRDYKVQRNARAGSWKQYTYILYKRNFQEEGTYKINIYSEDRAKNPSDNNTKAKELAFAVDKTGPSILISGVENGGQYRERIRQVTVDAQDNLCLEEVSVFLNGKETVYTKEELPDTGRITLLAGNADYWQELRVTARDGAGNLGRTETVRFLMTPDVMVLFLLNKRKVSGAVGLVVAVGTGVWRLLAAKRRGI